VARFSRRLGAVCLAVGLSVALAAVALANVTIKIVGQDPYTNTDSFHKTEVEPDTFSFGTTIVAGFQMGRHSDGGAANVGYATSPNSGGTWTSGGLPGLTVFSTPAGPYQRATDPAVGYDAKHNVWMVLALDSLTNFGFNGDAITVSRSTNGGQTWGMPVTVRQTASGSFDSTWMACDNAVASPAYGNCYVEFDDFGLGATFEMSRSNDGGLSWTSSTTPNTGVIGGKPLAQPNGHVVVPITSNPIGSQLAFVSTNGGTSYTGPNTIATIQSHPLSGGVRALDIMSDDVDANGKVYTVWYDCRFRSGCSTNDIVMSTSTTGQTWTAPVRIPIDLVSSTVDHFLPGIAVEPGTSGATAHLAVVYWYYDDASCSSCRLKYGFIESNDGGATWGTAHTIAGPFGVTWYPLTTSGYMTSDYSSVSWVGTGWQTVFAAAKQSTCQMAQHNCNVPMVAPRSVLTGPAGPTRPVGTKVLTKAGRLSPAAGLRSLN
jgi:hypothetical protein